MPRRTIVLASVAIAALVTAVFAQSSPFLGKWNITGTGKDAGNVYWLEVKQDGEQLSGMFLNRVGSPVRLAVVKVDGNELIFQGPGRGNQPGGPEYRARLDNGRLVVHTIVTRGRASEPGGTPPAPVERAVEWVGVRPPEWPAADANATHTYASPVVLVDGTSLDAWGVQHADRPMGWRTEDGAITNEKGSNNLVSKEKFMNFRLQAEYKLAAGSNSGIYLRGRYEIQLFDDAAHEGAPRNTDHAAIYGRTPASVNASRPPNEWQSLDIVLVANRVTVTLNGQRVHDNAVIEGVTGGALDNDESSPGPIMVQGDHSRVWIRKLVVTPIAGK
jgi:hypothetical protein